jgi:hypothetical protein
VQCYNYLSTPHPQLKAMVTENVDPDAVGSTGDQWISAGNAMVRFQEGVAAAISNSEADWQGKAGNSARTFMAQVGDWVGQAGQSAQLAGTQTNLQAVALADARRNMPDPVAFDADAANSDLQSTTSPLTYVAKLANYQMQYNQAQNAHQDAAGVVSMYDNNLAGASTMPAFGAPPQMTSNSTGETQVQQTKIDNTTGEVYRNNNVSTATTTNPGTTDLPPGQTDIPQTQTGDPGGPSGNPNNPGSPGNPNNPGIPGVPLPGPGGSGGGSGGSGTTPSGDLPNLPGPGQFPTPGSGGGGGGGVPGQNPAYTPPLAIGGLPGPTGGDLPRGGGRGFGPGGGFGGGPGGSGGYGTGGYGPGGGPGGGAGGGRPPGVGGMGPGGLGAGGALAAEGAAVRGGAPGARGAAGGGMVPAGKRGEGEEDGEHQRASYLVEGDPDAVFGTDQMTAPPVIGE